MSHKVFNVDTWNLVSRIEDDKLSTCLYLKIMCDQLHIVNFGYLKLKYLLGAYKVS